MLDPYENLYTLLNKSAANVMPADGQLLEAAAWSVLVAEGIEPRIGQPLPLADALSDCDFESDEIETNENDGSGMRRFGRVIVSWDSHNFRAVEIFHSPEYATIRFREYAEMFYPHNEEE